MIDGTLRLICANYAPTGDRVARKLRHFRAGWWIAHDQRRSVHKKFVGAGASFSVRADYFAETDQNAYIENDSQTCRDNHDLLVYALGSEQTLIRFVEQVRRKAEQRERVDKGREDSSAVIAESPRLVGGLGLQIHSEHRQRQGQRVGQVMPGVGYQRETMRLPTGGELNDDEQQRRNEGPLQDFAAATVVVMMIVRMHGSITRLTLFGGELQLGWGMREVAAFEV